MEVEVYMDVTVIGDVDQWAAQTFGAVNLRDRRRTRRLVKAAAQIARHPSQTFPQIFNWNDLRGFYRLCNSGEATLEAIQGPHWQQTRAAMGEHAVVLIVHDTTELDYTQHAALAGAGPIGDGEGRGFLQHNSLAVVPGSKEVLGLAYQQWRVREPAPKGERSPHRKQRDRESMLWMDGIRAIGQPPEGSCWVDVGDRGSDIYEAMEASLEMGHDFLFRVCQNRTVFTTPEQGQSAKLLDYARSLESRGSDAVEIRGRGKRPARTASVQLAGAPVWVPAPRETPQRAQRPLIGAWVIRVWEADPPADVEALEWLLLCSRRSTRLEEFKRRRDWYAHRWIVETYHDVEKNGCSEEKRRFETAARMEGCVAILALEAVRILQLRQALSVQPEAPARQVATDEEIEVIRRFTRHRSRTFTVRDFVHGVARLGGFLGRKSDGAPGLRTLWRGYHRLQDMLLGIRLHTSAQPSGP
jgi:hypothetical protein